MGFKVESLFAWVGVDDDGDEGVLTAQAQHEGQWITSPMMGADLDRVTRDANEAYGEQSARAVAKDLARQLGRPVRLLRSTGLEVLEVIEP